MVDFFLFFYVAFLLNMNPLYEAMGAIPSQVQPQDPDSHRFGINPPLPQEQILESSMLGGRVREQNYPHLRHGINHNKPGLAVNDTVNTVVLAGQAKNKKNSRAGKKMQKVRGMKRFGDRERPLSKNEPSFRVDYSRAKTHPPQEQQMKHLAVSGKT